MPMTMEDWIKHLDFISIRKIRELSVPLQCGAVPYVHWIPTTLNGFACLG